MKHLSRCLPLILIMHCPFSAFAEDGEPSLVTSPEAVRCASETDCDRDPKHLEQFITGFYSWYVDSEVRIYHLHPGSRREVPYKEKEKKLYTMLTPSFAAFIEDYERRAKLEDEVLDSDFILHGSDYFPEWASTAYSKAIYVDAHSARLTVYLPTPPDKKLFPPAPYCKVHVTLQPAEGTWRVAATGGDERDCSSDD